MNFKTTIVLLVLLVAIGIYIAVGRMHGSAPETTTTDTQTASKLISIDSGAVKEVSVTYADGKKLVIDRASAGWKMTQPVAAPADTFAVEQLVSSVTGLQSHGQLPADQIATVGLDHPKLTIELTATDGKTATVHVGEKSKISDDLYVQIEGKSQPEIVSSGSYDQLSKAADTYRSKKLVDASTDQIQSVSLTQGSQTIKIEKRGTGWTITQPTEMPADDSEMSSLLMAITDLNAAEFVNDPSTPASYGLTTPVEMVTFTTGSPATTAPASQPAPTTIVFGRYDSVLQKNVYASVNNGPIVTIPASSQTSLTKTALDLRDRKVVDIDPAVVEHITLKRNHIATTQPTSRPAEETEFALARRQESKTIGPVLPSTQPATTQAATEPSTQPASKWTVEGGGDANDTAVDALLTTLHPLKADKYLDHGPATQPADDYVLTIHAGPTGGHGAADYTLHLRGALAPAPATGEINGLTFETDRAILDKLDANYKK
jgi:hypothetical protein